MGDTIIKGIISFIITGSLGYCVSSVKGYRKKLKDKDEEGMLLKNALMTLFQNNLTNTYFAYEKIKEIPDYVYKNWLNSLATYEKLGGDDYVHVLAEKMKNWNFIKTDILKNGGSDEK